MRASSNTTWSSVSCERVFAGGGRERTLIIVRRARQRAMRLSVDPHDGEVVLSLPARAALRPALAWADAKRPWIEGQLARLPQPVPIVPGLVFALADVPTTIIWDSAASRLPHVRDGTLIVGGARESLAPRVLNFVRGEALRLLTAETHALATAHGITVAGVAVGDAGARWGSCAADGRIRYSWRLILAPGFVRRATVAHEVAHRLHMNHSPAFHAAAARLHDGDPTPARAWLRAHGSALHWFGRSS